MIQTETLVKITDNGGGTVGKVFKVLGSSKKRYASLGDLVIISVKVASPRKAVKKKTSTRPSSSVLDLHSVERTVHISVSMTMLSLS